MKGALAGVALACVASAAVAFVPVMAPHRATALYEKPKVKQEVTDLNLEDMFEVFDKADKSISDKEVGKAGGKDAGKDIADMLGSLFGGKKE